MFKSNRIKQEVHRLREIGEQVAQRALEIVQMPLPMATPNGNGTYSQNQQPEHQGE